MAESQRSFISKKIKICKYAIGIEYMSNKGSRWFIKLIDGRINPLIFTSWRLWFWMGKLSIYIAKYKKKDRSVAVIDPMKRGLKVS